MNLNIESFMTLTFNETIQFEYDRLICANRKQLCQICRYLDIENFSKLKKEKLIDLIIDTQGYRDYKMYTYLMYKYYDINNKTDNNTEYTDEDENEFFIYSIQKDKVLRSLMLLKNRAEDYRLLTEYQ